METLNRMTVLYAHETTSKNCGRSVSRYLEGKKAKEEGPNFNPGQAGFFFKQTGELPKIVMGIGQLGYKVVSQQTKKEKTSRLTPVDQNKRID